MGLIVGIDLGTTFSAVAQLDDVGRPSIIHNTDGSNTTPSVVLFEASDEVTVGEEARKQLHENPNSIGRFKRDMGTEQTFQSQFGAHTPLELSSYVLAKLKSDAETAKGTEIVEAVITVPANFGSRAREETQNAAEAAGLDVKFIIAEPTAAALYYANTEKTDLGGLYAVFDLGGGTFDVTVIEANGDEVEVIATEGVSSLGGADFDSALRDLVAERYAAETGGVASQDEYTQNDAEELKISLSKVESRTTRVYGTEGRADIKIERSEFEQVIATEMSKIELLCENVLEEIATKGYSHSQIREVLLAGGSTRVPAVVAAAERAFQKKPIQFANPDEVVALGAALYAGFRASKEKLNPAQKAAVAGIKVSEVTSKSFGTVSLGHNAARGMDELMNVTLIPKGTKIPTKQGQTFSTLTDGQMFADCQITESELPTTSLELVRVIWEGQLGPFPAGRPAGQPIEVIFSYDANQIMHCEFKDVSSGLTKEVDLSVTGQASEAAAAPAAKSEPQHEQSDRSSSSPIDRFTVD